MKIKLLKYKKYSIGLLGLLGSAFVNAACLPITAVPFEITSPGKYCLTQNLDTSIMNGNAITISSDYVTVDFLGYELKGSTDPFTQANGIYAQGFGHITIKGGGVIGFSKGLSLNSVSNVITGIPERIIVDDMSIHGSRTWGMVIRTVNGLIQNNHVANIGGQSAINGISPESVGISLDGANIHVINNDISNIIPPETGEIIIAGILILHSENILVVNNRITRSKNGVQALQSTGKIRDNLTFDVAIPYMGLTDVGNNN